MRYVLALIWLVLAAPSHAQDWEDMQVFNAGPDKTNLTIISSTDTDVFAPLLRSFVAAHSNISVEYFVTNTAEMDKRFRADPAAFDIAISSAMDLQLKLANDGFARPLVDISHPAWAEWRQSLFAFTSEPAALVFNKAAFTDMPVPQSRQELIEALRARPDMFRGRVATYDVRRSGLGYLFATQDARASESFWRLMEIMGGLGVQLYCCSGDMIDDLTTGKIIVAYNVLGSYAAARIDSQSALEIVQPKDFRTTMMRTALVSARSSQPDASTTFIRHLLDLQSGATNDALLLPQLTAGETEQAVIALEPALMTYLDALKRKKFLSEWEDAVIQK